MKRATQPSDYIYLLTALLFVITAIAGFIPTSFGLISRVVSGQQAFPPFIVHFHAASFSLWLLLLLAQTTLMYIKRPELHKRLGLVSFVLAPCILISMLGIEVFYVNHVLAPADTSPEQIMEYKRNISNILLIHGVSYLFFPTFYLWAILVRQKDNESHKRLMILATLVLMIPALGRLIGFSQVLPDLGLNTIDARHFYMLVLIVPAVVHDFVKNGMPHRTYLIGLALIGIWVVAAHYLWGSPWWIETAPKLFGV
ncbi:MAG: hypothetical protein RLN82_02940 [Pseudomonadales bacterium]